MAGRQSQRGFPPGGRGRQSSAGRFDRSKRAKRGSAEGLLGAGLRSLSFAIAALAVGFALKSGGIYAADADDVGTRSESPNRPSTLFDSRPMALQNRGDHLQIRLASLESDFSSYIGPAAEERQRTNGASFNDRFASSFGDRVSSFNERFSFTTEAASDMATNSIQPSRSVSELQVGPDARPEPVKRQNARLAMLHAPSGPLPGARPSVATLSVRPADPTDALKDPDSRTAVYDITSRVVYLPNGEKLEAHSGLGSHMDDPASVGVKNQGATPPNVYKLSLREQLFHGVRAIRLTPVDGSKMFGRDGLLAHSYMLGPNGDSNGCVSINDYPRFLNAFLNGEVDRLVVVERLANAPAPKTGIGWLERLKGLFSSS